MTLARIAELATGFALGELDEAELRELYGALRDARTGAASARVAWQALDVVGDLRSGLNERFQDALRHRLASAPDDGFAAILESATDLEEGDSVRGGADNSEILTTYTGSVPGDVVDKVIPGASGDFDLTAQITEDDELRELALTGVFYSGAEPNTYTVGFED